MPNASKLTENQALLMPCYVLGEMKEELILAKEIAEVNINIYTSNTSYHKAYMNI